MHILTLHATFRSLTFHAFRDGMDEPVLESELPLEPSDRGQRRLPADLLRQVRHALQDIGLPGPAAIALRALFGGERFARPVFVCDAVLAQLEPLLHRAPLHVPQVIELVHSTREAFPDAPMALVFETSFFARLPEREWRYGLDPETVESQSLRRVGFQGIYHEGACIDAARRLGMPQPRILSICLEPRPELAACLGRWPVVVTGGTTPAEGLPGETCCGDLDPSVVLRIAQDLGGGPEEASHVLTRHSGLQGLTGRPLSLADVLTDRDRDRDTQRQLAREVFLHAVLRACGAGIAAMGDVDAIVYSGRYATSGTVLHTWLNQRLEPALGRTIPSLIHTRSRAQHLRDIVRVMAREDGRGTRSH